MIVEGLITTVDASGKVNLAPLGPVVDESQSHFLLRPFQGSTTLANLRATGMAVFHIVDDVELIARAAINRLDTLPEMNRCEAVNGWILAGACRWFALRVTKIDDSQARVEVHTEIVAQQTLRSFWGFNRARHAVIEVAITATRVGLLPSDAILAEFVRLAPLVHKTGGGAEQHAWRLLVEHVAGKLGVAEQQLDPTVHTAARSVRVQSGSRLHFGMFSFGQPDVPAFGGLGVMLEQPSVIVEAAAVEGIEAHGPLDDVARGALVRAHDAGWFGSLPGCRFEVVRTPRHHVGLGVGTQLALSTVAAVNALAGGPLRSPQELARVSGRGGRSSIGTLGFANGGLMIEAGKLSDSASAVTELGPLVARVTLPEAWRWVLFTPARQAGLSGEAERQAFESLPAVPHAVTNELTKLAVLDIVPAAQASECRRFNETLHRFSALAGGCFAPFQAGRAFHPWSQAWLDRLRSRGIVGGAQSSWGPTLALAVESQDAAQSLIERLAITPADDVDVTIAQTANHGATVRIGNGVRGMGKSE